MTLLCFSIVFFDRCNCCAVRKSKLKRVDHDVFGMYLSEFLDLALKACILCDGNGAREMRIFVDFDGLHGGRSL